MKEIGHLVHLLRNILVRELVKALERDGFFIKTAIDYSVRINHPLPLNEGFLQGLSGQSIYRMA